MKSYRTAFIVTAMTALVLAMGVAVLAWRLSRQQTGAAATVLTSRNAPIASGNEAPPAASAEPPLAPVQLSPQRLQSIGVRVGRVESKRVTDTLRVYGTVQVNERRVAYVQSRIAGWIRDVHVDAVGDVVRRGQPLFTIYSPDLVATEREYLLARKNANELAGSSVAGVAAGARSLLAAAGERLRQWQVPDAEIARLERTGEVLDAIPIESPASGYVTERNALPNMYVQPDTKLYTIADLSEVWVLAQVFQNDAGKVTPGDRARITVDAYPGETFTGRVDYVLPQLDASTRTLPVRLVLPNRGLSLRPGMYVNVELALSMGTQLVVPASAVFHSGTRALVFAYRGDGLITPREIEVGPRVGGEQIVTGGVKPDEPIVTSANFLIDSEAQFQAAAGAFAPPPPVTSVAAAMNGPAQATIDMTTDPSPPRKGPNTVRVKLTDADGRGIPGARVTVTFFMPAMPAMGMAAMKTVVTMTDESGGVYRGTGNLPSGGTWQVTIAAARDGQSIATRHLSVNATGGM